MHVKKILDLFFKIFDLAKLLMISMTVVFLSFWINWLGPYVFFLPIFFLSSAALIVFIEYKRKTKEPCNVASIRWTVGYFIVVSISMIAVVARNFSQVNTAIAIILFLLCTCLIGVAIFVLIRHNAYKVKITKKQLIYWAPVTAIIVISCALSYDAFLTLPNFDSLDYYNALERINFNLLTHAGTMQLHSHITLFVSLSVYILSCIVGNLNTAAIMFNIIGLVVGIIVFFKFIKIVCPKCNLLFAYACTAVFAFAPITFGMTGDINPHNILLYTAMLFMLACFSKNEIFKFVTATILLFSFESAIIITGALIFGPILFSMLKEGYKKHVQHITVFNILMVVLHLFFVAVFFSNNWGAQDNTYLRIGFSTAPIETMIITNFGWIFILIAFAATIKVIIDLCRKKPGTWDMVKTLSPFILILVLLTGFNSFIITFNLIRYYGIHLELIYLLAFFGLYYLFKDFKFKYIPAIAAFMILPLLFVQSYLTIDPIMLHAHNAKLDTGGGYLVYVMKPRPPEGYFWISDVTNYNKQMNQHEIAFDSILREINYNSRMCIIVHYDFMQVGLRENAFGKFHGWNPETGRRFITSDHTLRINYYTIKFDDALVHFFENTDYEEYWFLDLGATVENLGHFESFTTVGETETTRYFAWRMSASKITLA